MPRKPDPKCVYCAKNYLTEDLAQKKNADCYVERNRNCYHKRNRILNASKINAQRRLNNARNKGITIIDPVLPDAVRVELIIYGKENVSIHAIALDIFRGNQLTHQMLPQHTMGLRQPAVEEYLDDVIERLIADYGADCFGLIYWVNSANCPVCLKRKEELGIEEKPEELSLALPDIADGFVADTLEKIDLWQVSSHSDRLKLHQSGDLMYRASTHILERVKLLLENLFRSPVAQGDTKINSSFSEFLRKRTQQTISTGFLAKYLQPRPRAVYEREAMVKVESLTPSQALEVFELELLESEVLSLAHDEDIDTWLVIVTSCVKDNPKIDNLRDIVETTGLSLVQVFISLLFGDFQLRQEGSFYDFKSIKVK